METLRRFFAELKRRNVYRVAVVYLIAAFVVLQLADLAAGAFGLPPWFEPMVWVLLGLGLPIALVVAWAFEMTPEGVRRTPAAAEAAGEPAPGEAVLATKALVGLGLLAAAAAGAWYLVGSGGEAVPRAGERSIAVLPFEELGQAEPSTFTEGMHDALLTRLSNVSGLKVISRTSVQQYRGTDKTTREIAREMGVKWVLEGGVQQMGQQIQVNAQLIDPRTDTHAWASQYRRDLTAANLFDLQSEITVEIARSLEARLSPEEERRVRRRPTGDLEAYGLYVRGRRLLDRRTGASIREAVDRFREALERDSSYALAWAGLADARGLYPFYGADSLAPALPDHRAAARRALELDADLAEAHSSMGYVHVLALEGPAALERLERAVELKPSYAQAHHWLGILLLAIGRPEPALEHLELAVELNPAHWNARFWRVDGLLAVGRYGEAVREARRGLDAYPEDGGWRGQILMGLALAGRWEELRQSAEAVLAEDSASTTALAGLALADEALGDTGSARRRRDLLGRRETLDMLAVAHAARGDAEAALATIEEALAGDPGDPTGDPVGAQRYWLGQARVVRYFLPAFHPPLRDHRRYRELIRQGNRAWGLEPDGSVPDADNEGPG